MAFGPFCLQTPECPQHRFLTLPLSSLDFPPEHCGFGLRLWLAGSPLTPAVSSSLSYGRVLHLQLLPTSPHGNAVSFAFRPENVCLKRTSTSLTISAFRRTSRPFGTLRICIHVHPALTCWATFTRPSGTELRRRALSYLKSRHRFLSIHILHCPGGVRVVGEGIVERAFAQHLLSRDYKSPGDAETVESQSCPN